VSSSSGSVSIEIVEPEKVKSILVLAHGAGAGMGHPFMVKLSQALADRGVATVRYNFPYMENGKGRPDPAPIAELTVEKIVEFARVRFAKVPLFAGGKSFGGRMTSQWASKKADHPLMGIVFYGFPLHPAGKPSIERSAHLKNIQVPMLFLQGTKDTLAELDLLKPVCASLPTATLTLFEGADHSFKASKKDNILELAETTAAWMKL
jgi:predicted alpha/beta-hydrolase family hydrolase